MPGGARDSGATATGPDGRIYAFGGFLVGLVLGLLTHGLALFLIIPAFVAYVVAHLVYLILAAVASNRGEYYAVPTLIALRSPRSTSSANTIAMLGPPMPVLWIVSGCPSAAATV